MSRIRLGGVPEHFNAPWSMAIEQGLFDSLGYDVRWTEHPGGTGEMLSALHDGDIDIALLLTEGAVADYAKTGSTRVLGTWVSTPLRWGIHVRPEAGISARHEVVGRRFAISRRTSGSHLMALLLLDSLGATPSDATLVPVGTIDGAREAFVRDEADVFLWEETMTSPLVAQGEFESVGVFQASWPAFVMVCLDRHQATLRRTLPELLSVVRPICEALTGSPGEGATTLARRFDVSEPDLRRWLEHTRWSPTTETNRRALEDAAAALRKAGAIETVPGLSEF